MIITEIRNDMPVLNSYDFDNANEFIKRIQEMGLNSIFVENLANLSRRTSELLRQLIETEQVCT
jgi:ribonucleotide monophosphatase NagD (HAD superfamily)